MFHGDRVDRRRDDAFWRPSINRASSLGELPLPDSDLRPPAGYHSTIRAGNEDGIPPQNRIDCFEVGIGQCAVERSASETNRKIGGIGHRVGTWFYRGGALLYRQSDPCDNIGR